jgi:hypothetical protein
MVHIIDDIFTDRVVTSDIDIRSVLLTSDKIVRVVAVLSIVADLVDHLGGCVDE